MTDDQIGDCVKRVGNSFIDLAYEARKNVSAELVIVSMIGALASVATASGMKSDSVIAALELALNDVST